MSDGVFRSAKVCTGEAVYKKPVVKLAPVLPGRDVFMMENRAGKLNSASRSFQAVKLE